MAVISKLPEELLHEILAYTFAPPDFDISITQPYTRIVPGSLCCDLLLVSKQWRRVGMPLLYRHLSISDQKQTKAIAALFDANPRLGSSVRTLSLYGGMGKELYTIVKHTPNLHTLNISSLYQKARDLVSGLRRAIPEMRIQHLCYSKGYRGRGNKVTKEIDALVMGAISEQWSSTLKSLTYDDKTSRPLQSAFVKTLRELPLLETITLNTPFLDTTLFSLGVVFNTLTEAPSLSRIRLLSLAQESHIRAYFEQLRTPQKLRDKVSFSRSHFDDLMDSFRQHLDLWGSDSDSESDLSVAFDD